MPTVKTISPGGQISLGKKYAGRTVVIDNPEEGVWVVKTASVIPDNERWLHQQPAKSKLEAGLNWAANHPVQETDLNGFEAQVLEVMKLKLTEPKPTKPKPTEPKLVKG